MRPIFENYQVYYAICEECGCKIVEDEDDYNWCPQCETDKVGVEEIARPPLWVSVAMYEVGRAYGGPEEGGWWYDVGNLIPETVRCFEAADAPLADQYRELLLMRWPSTRDQKYSVSVTLERLPPAGFPASRPRYS